MVCLRSSCCHVTEVGGAVGFVRLALKVTQYYGDFVDVILLYSSFCAFAVSASTLSIPKSHRLLGEQKHRKTDWGTI